MARVRGWEGGWFGGGGGGGGGKNFATYSYGEGGGGEFGLAYFEGGLGDFFNTSFLRFFFAKVTLQVL